ncbi:MAG TPA: helix-turn-helix domain-containing protein [Candidatus Udaeobacter sp.]
MKRRFVRTKRELAECLGISRPTLDRLFNRFQNPGMLDDGRYDVAEWRYCAWVHVCPWQRRKRYR